MNISKALLFVGVSMIFVVGFAACNKPGPAETAGKTIDNAATDMGDKIEDASNKLDEQSDKAGVAISDTAITAKVKAAILAEPGLRVLQIDVDTENGVTTLKGSVDSQKSSDNAKEIASAVSGVKRVDNQLAVN